MAGSFPQLSPSRQFAAALVLLCLVGLVLAGERLYVSHLRNDWEEVSRREADASARELRSEFSAYQEETRAAVEAALLRVQQSPGSAGAAAFALLSRGARPDIALEFRSARKEVIAWSGNRGPLIDTAMLTPGPASFVLQGPIYSYLVVSLPLPGDGAPAGYLVGKRLLDVTLPINNRFISSTTFTATLTARLGFQPEFRFPSAASRPDSASLAVPLDGIGGTPIGAGLLPRPTLTMMTDAAHRAALRWSGVLLLAFVLFVATAALPGLLRGASRSLRALSWTAFIWTVRYALLWLEFPGSLFDPGFFDPIYFASPFGFGLAQSLGDMCISSLALFLNILAVVPPTMRPATGGPSGASARRFAPLLLIVPAAFVLFMLLRAFMATIHSAVFDSSLSYNDPASLFPTADVAVMLLSLFFLSLSLVLAAAGILLLAVRAVRGAFPGLSALLAWGAVAGIILLLSALFGAVYHHSLMSQEARIAVLLGLIIGTAWVERALGRGLSPVAGLVTWTLVSAALLVPPLDAKVHELDRNHVELMAREILRPADGWLSFVVNRSLDEITQGDAARILREGGSDDIEKLAFTRWAKSILSREGNNCSVTFIDAEGTVVSDFHIGIAQQWFRRHAMDEMPRSNRLVEVEDRSDGGGIVKWYRGYAPVYDEDSLFLGGVWVDLSGANQRMLRGESEEILRNSSREDFASHHRRLFFFEYFEGELVSSTVEEAPLHAAIPAEAASFADSSDGVWTSLPLGAKTYEVHFLPDGSRGKRGSWIALGMEQLDIRWHVYSFLRYASFFLLLALASILAILGATALKGKRHPADFRAKLLVAFLVVSLIPLVILAYYNRAAAAERATESTERELARQTLAVTGAIERTLGAGTPALVARISDEQCEELAAAMETDFNVYRGAGLQASSKPEMFMAELLDRSLSAAAYVSVVLERKNFFAERQSIGSLPYIVGYRPLLAENGRVAGVVSVPTLYSRNEIEAELTESNAFLYGAYALALVLSLVVGSLFANQIASPVRRLKHATSELARGNMNVELRRSGTDELGDLEEAFARMTSDLRRAQEQMLKAQKELAWKEMAQQVAHEIKNPLTPMKLSVQHLRAAYRDKVPDFGDVLGRVSATVLDQIDALARIASEFSSFARMPERRPEPVDVHAILAEAKNLFQAGDVAFRTDFAASRAVVRADREELRRVFINIIRNSVQAMGGGGTIAVSTSVAGGLLAVALRDTGPGIPPEVRARLFEPNFSTKTDGMGLGLTIARSTIENLGGMIEIDSVPGDGTIVTITIPLLEP